MKRVFAGLFPFESPAWNSGALDFSVRSLNHQAYPALIVLATFYISSYVPSQTFCLGPFPFRSRFYSNTQALAHIRSIPNFILLLVPSTLEPSSLNTMIAFATGGLLGDVFLHLVPHAFFGEGNESAGKIVRIEEKKNIVIG